MNAAKLNIDMETEVIVGTEDRVFRAEDGWYWQARGSSDCFGPFDTQEDAEADYDAN